MKEKILNWLKNNGIEVGERKMRLINYKGIPELRIYTHAMEFTSSRKSRRKLKEVDENGYNCTYGYHEIRIPMYIHISLDDIKRAEKDEDEKEFLLQQFKEL